MQWWVDFWKQNAAKINRNTTILKQKMNLKKLSAKWRSFRLHPNELTIDGFIPEVKLRFIDTM